MSKTWRKKDFWSVLEKNSPVNVTFWGYALSELGLSTVEFARKYKILINIILPSAVADDLYYSSKLNLIVCLKNIKSFAKILLKKAFGSPIKVKTYNNYLYDCIDTRYVTSITTFKEITSKKWSSKKLFNHLVSFVKNNYPEIISNINTKSKVCIILDEDLEFYEKRVEIPAKNILNKFGNILNELKLNGYNVYLKPTYYGKPYLSKFFKFTFVIPGQIPLQALDLLVPKNTVITGWSATYLHESSLNFRSIPIKQLPLYIKKIS